MLEVLAQHYGRHRRKTEVSSATFVSRADLIPKAGPHYIELFNQISLHVCSLVPTSNSEPASKKRRLDEELTSRPASNGTNGYTKPTPTIGASAASGKDPVLLELKDVSLVIPQRKKYTLCFTPTHLYARLPDSKEPVAGISYAWSDIGKYLVCCFGECSSNKS
jgi:hypothetical protein